MNKRFQLIKPFIGEKVYETSSLKKGAKKCYQEFKQSQNNKTNEFSVLNIDTHETYRYKVNHNQDGGNLPNDKKIIELEKRISALEQKFISQSAQNGGYSTNASQDSINVLNRGAANRSN